MINVPCSTINTLRMYTKCIDSSMQKRSHTPGKPNTFTVIQLSGVGIHKRHRHCYPLQPVYTHYTYVWNFTVMCNYDSMFTVCLLADNASSRKCSQHRQVPRSWRSWRMLKNNWQTYARRFSMPVPWRSLVSVQKYCVVVFRLTPDGLVQGSMPPI